jgi:peroxiredoxin
MKKKFLIILFCCISYIGFAQAEIGLEIGNIAPEINLQDKDGNMIPLSSLRGKVVLINFWAAGLRPCWQEIPNLVKIYNEYKDENFSIGNGFSIYGISLDKDKKLWANTIDKNKLSWINVSDVKSWKSETVKIYNIRAIPACFLIDGNGIIIAKNLRGKQMVVTLESYTERTY